MSRIILKLSGEALAGPKRMGFDEETVRGVAKQVRELIESGCQVGIVTGGGNFWRGRTGNEIDRVKADQIGMLAICGSFGFWTAAALLVDAFCLWMIFRPARKN